MSQFEGSRKLEDIRHDNFRRLQGYFNDKNLEKARLKFKIRTKMFEEKKPGIFKNLYKNQENGLKCKFCPEEMTQNHCIVCPGRVNMRIGMDMTNLDNLVEYFTEILNN